MCQHGVFDEPQLPAGTRKQRALRRVFEEAAPTRRLTAFLASLAKRHSTTAAKTVVARLVSNGVLKDDEAKTIAAAVERGPASL